MTGGGPGSGSMFDELLKSDKEDQRRKSALALKLSQCLDLEDKDLDRIAEFEAAPKAFGSGEDLLEENCAFEHAGVVLEGWCFKYKLLDDGRRQIVNFILPGGFVGLHGNVFQVADHSVSTLTRCKISTFDPQLVTKTFAERPLLGAAIVWDNAREEAILMERLASLGRRSAYERFAHLMVELAKQMNRRGFIGEEKVVLPVPQAVVADTLGLSLVHVSRTIQKLRRNGLIEPSQQRGIVLRDLRGLMEVCGFDETYLHQDRLPERTRRQIDKH